MNKTLKKQWTKALRSGKYQQGKTWLRKEDSGQEQFCCLGVLCNLVEPGQWRKTDGTKTWRNGSGKESDASMPRNSLQEKLGLNKPCSRDVSSNSIADELAHMNDHEGLNFNEIADWIEKHVN